MQYLYQRLYYYLQKRGVVDVVNYNIKDSHKIRRSRSYKKRFQTARQTSFKPQDNEFLTYKARRFQIKRSKEVRFRVQIKKLSVIKPRFELEYKQMRDSDKCLIAFSFLINKYLFLNFERSQSLYQTSNFCLI